MIDTFQDIKALFEQKSVDALWAFNHCKPSDTGKWTNSYHRYPAKFIPQLVEQLLDEYEIEKEALVNDPFYGSGTTLVSSLAKGCRVCGTDINKFSFLLSKVKTRPLPPTYLAEKVGIFYDKVLHLETIEPSIPKQHLERIDYWFEEENKIKLGKILTLINEEPNNAIREFLLVAISNILKNCSIWLQKSNKPTRDLKKPLQEPEKVLKRQLNKMLRGNRAYWNNVSSEVKENFDNYIDIHCGDATQQKVADDSVDIIITSSPYVTSYEYADLHQLTTIWLDLTDDLKEYRKEFIGTAFKKTENENVKLCSPIANEIVEKMKTKNKRKASDISIFFADMEKVIAESYRILKKDSLACYVIGNTKLRGVDIFNAEVFIEIMLSVGFSLERIIKREIPSKLLPQTRDKKTGRFAKTTNHTSLAYPTEYIVIGKK